MTTKKPSCPTTLTVVAIRPAAGESSPDAPVATIVSMLRLMPGATLHIRSGALPATAGEPASMGQRLWLTGVVDADAHTQLRAVIDRNFEVTETPLDTADAEYRWHGLPEAGELGFVPHQSRSRVWTLGADEAPDMTRLWQALAAWPSGRIDATVSAQTRGDFCVSVSLSGDTPPPLMVRAAATDVFQGLQFTASDDEPESLRCTEDEARTVVMLPVGTSSWAPPGFRVGAPSMMPVRLALSSNPIDDSRIRLGWARTDAGTHVDVALGDQELLRHVHLVGATGTGKSSMLAGIIHQLAHSDNGALLLDPHGTLVDRVLSELPAHAIDRVRVVRADDIDAPVALNPLATDSPLGIQAAIADMGEMFHELFDPGRTGIVGPRFVDRVAHALRALVILRGEYASLLDVPLMLGHKGMRKALVERLTDPAEKLWWENDLLNQRSTEYGDLTSWVNSKFETFSASPAMRAILGSGADTYNPVAAMDSGEIILVDLAKGTIGKDAARLLGYLLLNRFWVAAMNRSGNRRFHIVVDEAHSVMAGSLINMLSEGRKFGLSVVVAHQFLGQLQPAVTSALSGNVGTSVTFRSSGPHIAEQIAATGGQVNAQTLANLPTLSAIVVRNAGDDVTPAPHTVRVEQAQDGCRRANRSAVEVLSRQRNRRAQSGRVPLDPDVDFPVLSRPTAGEDSTSRGKFLDEWLEKRKRLQENSATKAPGDDDSEALAGDTAASSDDTTVPDDDLTESGEVA